MHTRGNDLVFHCKLRRLPGSSCRSAAGCGPGRMAYSSGHQGHLVAAFCLLSLLRRSKDLLTQMSSTAAACDVAGNFWTPISCPVISVKVTTTHYCVRNGWFATSRPSLHPSPSTPSMVSTATATGSLPGSWPTTTHHNAQTRRHAPSPGLWRLHQHLLRPILPDRLICPPRAKVHPPHPVSLHRHRRCNEVDRPRALVQRNPAEQLL